MIRNSSAATEPRRATVARRISAIAFLVSMCALLFTACGGEQPANTATTTNANRGAASSANQNQASVNANESAKATGPNPTAVIDTDAGTIKIELLRSDAPVTVENFVQLAKKGYYDGLIFHRVIRGFMIQGGDPRGDGTGGATATGRPLPNEINLNSPLYQGGYKRGVVAMANRGRPETAGSQFFIMHGDRSFSQLPPNYTIFGRVISGMDAVDKIATAPTTTTPTGEPSRPVNPVKMKKVTIQ
ncbi:MAG TPA: peptidylprolyl isomerase [Blastocatellia bacterium]|nr:peptidylprolyl isomerase [Blastocatellia bacterium]